MKLKHFYSFLYIFILISISQAQIRTENFDTFLKTSHERNQFNGNVLIAENGKIIYQKAFGIISPKSEEELTLDHQFRLGSVSKQFTAMAIMILKDRGKLKFNDDITKYLPNFPYKNITIKQLLNHTGGLPDYMRLFAEDWDINQKNFSKKKVADNEDFLKLFIKHKPKISFTPGEKFEYSNTGYVLLALIADRASGQPFNVFVKENIFKPLGMNNSLVFSEIRKDKMDKRVYGFRRDYKGQKLDNDFHFLNGIAGDGAIYSTLEDLLKWDQALYTTKLVTEETFKMARAYARLNSGALVDYGFGWTLGKTLTNKKLMSHGGSWVGFRAFIHREIDDNRTILCLTNNSTNSLRELVKGLENILHNKEYQLPRISIAETIYNSLKENDLDETKELYKNIVKNKASEYNLRENELNRLGYMLLNEKEIDKAILVFHLNTETYPHSANVFDSYGDGFVENEDYEKAIKQFKKALEIDSSLEQTREKLNKLLKKIEE